MGLVACRKFSIPNALQEVSQNTPFLCIMQLFLFLMKTMRLVSYRSWIVSGLLFLCIFCSGDIYMYVCNFRHKIKIFTLVKRCKVIKLQYNLQAS